jgi:uncharacterized membrane-anchored protein
MNRRTLVMWGGAALVLSVVSGLVIHKEHVLASGEPLLLALRPVDPRSLIQGDYMRLRYAITADAAWPDDGKMVVRRDAGGVAQRVRLYDGGALQPGELVLRYRQRDGDTRLGAEAFYFQEGDADRYAHAKYGELRVGPSGESVLVGLRDENKTLLGALGDGDGAKR